MKSTPYPIVLKIIISIGFLSLFLLACKSTPPTSTPIPAPSPTATALPTATPTSTPTPTSPPPLAVLLAPPGSDAQQAQEMQSALYDSITAAGLRWQVRPSLSQADLTSELRLVIALPPDQGLANLANAAPETQFLAVGIPITATSNLSVIISGEARPDQQGFLAGVIAAMITPDWRVGVIAVAKTDGVAESAAGKAAENGFFNGATYFCGLCLQAYPPFYDYPLSIELKTEASSAEWQIAANYMVDHLAQTVYVVPGAGDKAMLETLVQSKVNVISEGPPAEELRSHWVASLRFADTLPFVLDLVPDLLNGKGGFNISVPLIITDVNADLFSPGRQRLAEEVMGDLLAGFVDTGVDPLTGELK